MKTVMKYFSIVALVAAFSVAVSGSAFAGNKNETPGASSIELKYIGNHENQPVFELNLANKESDEFTITIRDEYGNLLYAGREKGTNITRKFMLNDEVSDTDLYVEVKSKKNSKSETYKISKSYSYTEQHIVSASK